MIDAAWFEPALFPSILLVGFGRSTGLDLDAALRREGFCLRSTQSSEDAATLVCEGDVSLVLIHADPSDGSGLLLCKELRARSRVPVIVISDHDGEANAVAALDAGADDYLCRPQRIRELVARIRAALRRSPIPPVGDDHVLMVGDVVLDRARHEVRVRGEKVELPLREFEVLEALIASPGRVWSRAALVRKVWGETPASGTKSLDVHIRRIRSRIEDEPSEPTRILTVRGIGYKYASLAQGR